MYSYLQVCSHWWTAKSSFRIADANFSKKKRVLGVASLLDSSREISHNQFNFSKEVCRGSCWACIHKGVRAVLNNSNLYYSFRVASNRWGVYLYCGVLNFGGHNSQKNKPCYLTSKWRNYLLLISILPLWQGNPKKVGIFFWLFLFFFWVSGHLTTFFGEIGE